MLSVDVLLRREALMSGAQSSERAFIETLFAQHHAEIYGFLVRMVRDEDLAADLAQETFVKAFRAVGTLEDRARARGWLFQIASRTALDELRRQRVIRFVPWSGESRGVAPSAEETALRGTMSVELERALAQIPARQRSALLLAEIHELNGLELASALGVSHVAARALLTRARESLRQALAEERSRSARRDGSGGRFLGDRADGAQRVEDHSEGDGAQRGESNATDRRTFHTDGMPAPSRSGARQTQPEDRPSRSDSQWRAITPATQDEES